jgi:hypothetical protein
MAAGVLVHGPHLQAEGWLELAWGIPPLHMGRIPKAIQVLWKRRASREMGALYFGTGASERDGVKEAECMFNLLLERKAQLNQFDALRSFGGLDISYLPDGPVLYVGNQARAIIVDTVPQNTREEILSAADHFLQIGVDEMVLVSSATHMPRCLRDALAALNDPVHEGKYRRLAQNLYAAPADTCYAGADFESTVIFEAPHRGDRPKYPLNQRARSLMRVKPENLERFGIELEELVSKYI